MRRQSEIINRPDVLQNLKFILKRFAEFVPAYWVCDLNGDVILCTRGKEAGDRLCPMSREDPEEEYLCDRDFIEDVERVLKTRRPTSSTCRFGYTRFVTPIFFGGEIIGTLGTCQKVLSEPIFVSDEDLLEGMELDISEIIKALEAEKLEQLERVATSMELFSAIAGMTSQPIVEKLESGAKGYEITLGDIGKLVNSTLDPSEMLKLVAKAISRRMQVDCCLIFLLDGEGNVDIVQEFGLPGDAARKGGFSSDEGEFFRRVSESREPLEISDPSHRMLSIGGSYASFLGVSIRGRDGTPLGGVVVGTVVPREFTEGEVEDLSAIAGRLENGFNNSRFYSEIKRRLDRASAPAVPEDGEEGALSINGLLDSIVTTSAQIMKARGCILRLIDEDTKRLEIKASFGVGKDVARNASLNWGEGIAGWVAGNKKPLLVPDVSKDDRFSNAVKAIVSSVACVPLQSKDKVLGTLAVYDKCEGEGTSFTENDLRLLSILAAQASIAIEDAGLVSTLESAQRKIASTQNQLIQKEKFAALGEIAAGVAHDIKNPLVSIGGFARRLYRHLGEGDPARNYAAIIVKEVAKVEKIVADILNYLQEPEERFNPKEVDVNNIIEESLFSLDDKMMEYKVELVKDMPPLPPIVADPQQLMQVMLNVIDNAIEAMEGGGELTVTTRQEGENISISIGDTGCGIPKDIIKNIYDPFFTTKARGTGLGLTIAYRVVRLHGGDIQVRSKVGKGTTFTIVLPTGKSGV
ncbi:MAG: GAF domain-containing protein [bacterium]